MEEINEMLSPSHSILAEAVMMACATKEVPAAYCSHGSNGGFAMLPQVMRRALRAAPLLPRFLLP